MMTAQPTWKQLYATDYSALYVDEMDLYPPELHIAQDYDDVDVDDIEAIAAVVYRFPLERCWQVTRDDGSTVLVSLDPSRTDLPHPIESYRPWFADHLGSIASSCGRSIASLVSDLCSDNPRALARVYEDIGGHHGFANLDNYPEEWTATEFAAWPDRGPKLITEERAAFANGYISCALWCGVMVYKHDDECPCREASENGDAYDADKCECEPDMQSSYNEHDESELTDDALRQLSDDAHGFYAVSVVDLRASTLSMDRAGHDLWLTRNRHGAGYWDEKHISPEADKALDALTKAAHSEGECHLLQGADMKIVVM